MPEQQPLDAIVIGAGISGLCAGWALRKAGKRYKVLEKSKRPGGPIETLQEDGFVFEKGPNTIQVDGPDLDIFFAELGLKETLVEANREANKRFIVRNQIPQAVPMSPRDIFSTKLFSKRAMLSLLTEPFKKKYSGNKDESLADFVRRRLNQEFLDYAINPLIGGIYAGDPEELSAKHAFPKIYNLEARFGSLIKGGIGLTRERKAHGTYYKTKLISFQDGMEALPQTLSEKQSENILFSTDITSICKEDEHLWSLNYTHSDGSKHRIDSRKIIVACPASALLALPFSEDIKRALGVFSEIPHPPLVALSLGYDRDAIAHPLDGFGMLVPRVENMNILGCIFASSLFPGRSSGDRVGLSVFIGGTRNPELCEMDESELLGLVKADLEKLLGASGDPIYVRRTDWPRAIPQYVVGYQKYLQQFEDLESAHSGLKFIGHLVDGISVPKCIRSGLNQSS